MICKGVAGESGHGESAMGAFGSDVVRCGRRGQARRYVFGR
jgi:hypothetical protein